jgi:polyisoprenoid-binding protein YceI
MLKPLLSAAAFILFSQHAIADWSIDNQLSRVNFVSVKKNTIGEAHYFKQVSGVLTASGSFNVEINLGSVETLIPIRNERMAKHLFNTNLFPTLNLSTDLSKELPAIKKGNSQIIKATADITLNNITKKVIVEVLATQHNNGNIIVSSFMPVIVNPADFNLTAGIEILQGLAKLPSITQSVPVSFTLTLQKHN